MEYKETGEDCGGLAIPLLEIQEEEKLLKITITRLKDVQNLTCQNIFEYSRFLTRKGDLIFAGFLAHIRADLFDEIIQETNHDHFEILSLYANVFEYEDEFIDYFCRFINNTTHSKARVNQYLISVMKYYD